MYQSNISLNTQEVPGTVAVFAALAVEETVTIFSSIAIIQAEVQGTSVFIRGLEGELWPSPHSSFINDTWKE